MGDNGNIDKDVVKVEDLILAVKRGEGGNISTLVNPETRIELEIAIMRLNHQCYGVLNAMSYADQQGKSKIVKPSGIIDFARKLKR